MKSLSDLDRERFRLIRNSLSQRSASYNEAIAAFNREVTAAQLRLNEHVELLDDVVDEANAFTDDIAEEIAKSAEDTSDPDLRDRLMLWAEEFDKADVLSDVSTNAYNGFVIDTTRIMKEFDALTMTLRANDFKKGRA